MKEEQILTPIVIILILLLCFIPDIVAESCLDKCVLSSRYWLENGATSQLYTSNREDIKLWPTKCSEGNGISEFNYIFNKTSRWGSIIQSKGHNSCINFAKQYITLRLNLCRGTCVNDQIYEAIPEAYDILETQCTENGIIIDPNITKTNIMIRIDQLFSSYNIGELINERCGITTKLDCNKNGVLDACEVNYEPYIGICNTKHIHMTSLLDMCTLDKTLSAQDVCDILNRKIEKDCDKNFILDSCQIASKNDLDCASTRCRNFNNAHDFPKSCLTCKSDDVDNDWIPDSCQNYEIMLNKFNNVPPTNPILKDCNSDGVDDEYSISLGLNEDFNENGIPDDCEFGSCCNKGECFETTVDKCQNKTFSRAVLCSERDDCFIPDKSLFIGSCCRRTSGINPYMICESNVTVAYCDTVFGYWSDDSCDIRDCSKTSAGSCCYDYSNNSLCYKKVSHEVCSQLNSKRFIFDKKDCPKDGCLCNGIMNKTGTCIKYDKCIKNITVNDCEQLMGIFDNLPCELRLDRYNDTIGSCCSRDGSCIDLVTSYKCKSINGNFSNDSCAEKNFCKPRITNDCCLDDVGYCMPMVSDGCLNMLGNFTPVKCENYTMCNLVQHTGDGCCVVKNRCIKSVNETQCLFFNGKYVDSLGCLTNKLCFDTIFNFEIMTKTTSNAILPVNGDINNVIAIDSNDAGSVATVTVFSVVFGILFIVFLVLSGVILYNRPRPN